MKRLLGVFAIFVAIALTNLVFSNYLNTTDTLETYKNFVERYLSGSSDEGFISFVKGELPNLSLYRFYKTKMVGSVDKRESALHIPYFLMALLSSEKVEMPGEKAFRIGKVCEEEGLSFEFSIIVDEEEERKNAIEKEQNCLKKVMEIYGDKIPKVQRYSINFNEIFAKALFLSFIESRLRNVNLTSSLVKNSAALTYSFNLYNDYVSKDLDIVFVHALGYYSGVVDEKLPFEIEGLSRLSIKGIKYEKVYPGEKYLKDFEKAFDQDDPLGFKERLRIAIEYLKGLDFNDNRDFEWKIKVVSEYIYENFVEPNLRKIEWSDLKKSAPMMIEHTIAYYLGGTNLVPPIRLDLKIFKSSCGNSYCSYRFYRYRAPEELRGILNLPHVRKKIKEVVEDLQKYEGGSSRDFSKYLEDRATEIEELARADIDGLKDEFAVEVVRVTPKLHKFGWIRFLVYGLLIFLSLYRKKHFRTIILLISIVEMIYIAFFMNLSNMGEAFIYSLGIFFVYAFVMLLSISSWKKKLSFLILGSLFFIFLFLPNYISPKSLLMDNNKDFYSSPYYGLLKDDLYDGHKFEIKKELTEEEIVSRFGRLLSDALSSPKGIKSGSFKKAYALADNIVKYSGKTLREDFKDFLYNRTRFRKEFKDKFDEIFKKYENSYYSPSCISIQTLNGAKAALIFMLIFSLAYFGFNRKFLGIVGLIFSGFLMIPSGKIFVEYALPLLKVKGALFIPWVQILLFVLSLILLFYKRKNSEGRVKV